jgi:hypothetical protein
MVRIILEKLLEFFLSGKGGTLALQLRYLQPQLPFRLLFAFWAVEMFAPEIAVDRAY